METSTRMLWKHVNEGLIDIDNDVSTDDSEMSQYKMHLI